MWRHEKIPKAIDSRETMDRGLSANGPGNAVWRTRVAADMATATVDEQAAKVEESPVWQFSLRGLLVGVLLLSMVFSLMRYFGPLGKTLIAWIAILVAGHVWATAMGTFLRQHHRRRRLPDGETKATTAARTAAARKGGEVPLSAMIASPSAIHLRQQSALASRVRMPIVVGALLGAVGGGVVLRGAYGAEQSIGGVALVLGSASAAVIGGLFGFMASSCFHVARTAWLEAARGEDGRVRDACRQGNSRRAEDGDDD